MRYQLKKEKKKKMKKKKKKLKKKEGLFVVSFFFLFFSKQSNSWGKGLGVGGLGRWARLVTKGSTILMTSPRQ